MLNHGTRLGRYEIRAPLGAGGMGEVYRAWDHDLEREVAIKILREGTAQSSDRVHRFLQEAKAASALNHPNVAYVYDTGTHGDMQYIAMELVDGVTLRDRVANGPLSIEETLALGTQITAALAAAHKAGIIHRDIKPENVIIRPDGYAKVVDFGVAKLSDLRGPDAATVLMTKPGVSVGTLAYMSPEQLNGQDVTPASDVFSLGVVLYEMLSGQNPFRASTVADLITSITTKTPRDLSGDVHPRLRAVIAKALAKKESERYSSASGLHEELKSISRETVLPPSVARPRSKAMMQTVAAVVVLALIGAGMWMYGRSRRMRTAEEQIVSAEKMASVGDLVGAYRAAVAASAVFPADPRVIDVLSRTSQKATIESDPPGARVYLERFKAKEERWFAGETPLTIPRLARADYIVTFEKDGYASARRPLSMAPMFFQGSLDVIRRPSNATAKLIEAARVPAEMVYVTGGPTRLSGWSPVSDRIVDLREYLIDRYEVSNREYAEFVRAGGYRKRDLWGPFVDEKGASVPFEMAMGRFRDTTGLPGPRKWSGGEPPAGREDHPVTGISWYEASAYAKWKGKRLPTIYQWDRASRIPRTPGSGRIFPWGLVMEGVDVTERANFSEKGTVPVDSLPFGLSPFGAEQMAGNVTEWARNPAAPGFAVRGGSWADPTYTFSATGAYPPFYSSDTLGFRCMKDLSGDGDEQGEFAINLDPVIRHYQPVDDATFASFKSRYTYARAVMTSRVIERVDAPQWTREKVQIAVAGEEPVLIYVYVPKGFRPPLQVIHFAPAGDVARGQRSLPGSIEANYAAFVRGGRALFALVSEGQIERPQPPDYVQPDSRTPAFIDWTARQVTEMRRAVDYIASRKEMDVSRLAFIGASAGSWEGVILTALEDRYRSVAFVGAAIEPNESGDIAAANRINFAPRIRPPKLMLQGRYDETDPLRTEALPLFELFVEPKRLIVFEGGHMPTVDVLVPTLQAWLDETLGPVEN